MRRAPVGTNEWNGQATATGGNHHHIYEQQNEEMIDDLKGKVGALKSLTIDIGHEVQIQNKYLSEMDSDFGRTGGFLGQTMSRLGDLAKLRIKPTMFCYLILFSFLVFLVLWYVIRFR